MATKPSKRRSKRSQKPVAASEDWDRRHMPSSRLHESEMLLVGLLALLLIFLPWAIGSTHVVAQAVACFLAFASLGAALLPRHGSAYTITSAGQFKRLLAFPVFWIGGLLLLYVLAQGFNIAWKVEGTEGFHWVEESSHIAWLPSSVAGQDGGRFAWLLILGTPFLAVCAAWIGLTRRKSIVILLSAVCFSGLLLAGLGAFQISKRTTEIFWFYEPPTALFLSTFPHHWQGAAYLALLLAAALGLAAHHHAAALKTFRRSNPSGLFLFIGLALMVTIFFSCSRVTAGVAGGIMAAFLARIAYGKLIGDFPLPSRKIFLGFLALSVIALGVGIGDNIGKTFIDRESRIEPIDEAAIAAEGSWSATWEAGKILLKKQPVYGWGTESFKHIYKEEAVNADIDGVPPSLKAEYAASDWIRFPVEFGIAGTLLMLLMFGYLLKFYFSRQAFQNPIAAFLLLGTIAGLILGLPSLTFNNPAFLTTWSVFLTMGVILVRVEIAVGSRGVQQSES